MQNQALTAADFDFIDDLFQAHGNEHSVLNASELDGFFTALVSGPAQVDFGQLFQAIWGGQVPAMPEAELRRFIDLCMRHLNTLAGQLGMEPQAFQPRFETREHQGQPLVMAEEWCFGYLRGVEVAGWTEQPAALQAISLVAEQDTFELPVNFDVPLHRQRVAAVKPAVLALHAHWR